MAVDVPLYIKYGKCTQFLSATEVAMRNVLRGAGTVQNYSRIVYIVRRQIEYRRGLDSSDPTLDTTSNYMYALCGKYIQRAKQLIANMGTGIIVNPANGVQSTLQPVYLQFRVGVTASPVVVNGENVTLPIDGGNSFVIPLTYILNSLEGTLDGVQVPMSDPLQTSMVINYTNNNATVTLQDGATFHNNDLWIFDGYQYVAI